MKQAWVLAETENRKYKMRKLRLFQNKSHHIAVKNSVQ